MNHIKSGATSGTKRIARFRDQLPTLGNMALKQFFDAYNLLGYDNGDGELSCSWAVYDEKLGEPVIVELNLNAAAATHVPNILAFQDGNGILVDKTSLSKNAVYQNFKLCPGVDSKQKYVFENGEEAPYSYEDLMGHSFACAVARLFENNVGLSYIDESGKRVKKPTVIMVGHPSAKDWDDKEDAYKEILNRYVKQYLPDVEIRILVMPESLAAMAGVLGMKQEDWLNSFVQILDLGSSTFDITTVTPEGVLKNGEDSYVFGGNQLDEAMVHFVDQKCNERITELSVREQKAYAPEPDQRKKSRLRFLKEERHGENGEELDNEDLDMLLGYHCKLNPVDGEGKAKKFSIFIDEDTMEEILDNPDERKALQCKARHLDLGKRECISWIAACGFVMRQFYKKTKALDHGRYPRRLILTGGVSNMREVRDIARVVFGVEPELAPKPSLSVSNGLARVLAWEIIKKTTADELLRELDALMPSAEQIRAIMADRCAEVDLDYYQEVIQKWAKEGYGERTLNSCIQLLADENNGIFERYKTTLFLSEIPERLLSSDRINAVLRQKFRQMFPRFSHDFAYRFHIPDLGSMKIKPLKNDYGINIYMFFDSGNCPADPYNVDARFDRVQREKILEVFKRHRAKLKSGGKADCGGAHVFELPGVLSVYEKQLSVKEDAEPLRSELLAAIKPQIIEFVEEHTYYLSAAPKK